MTRIVLFCGGRGSATIIRALLRQSAGGQAWDPQMGWGVANLAKARQALGLD
jgi:hypothetical protein